MDRDQLRAILRFSDQASFGELVRRQRQIVMLRAITHHDDRRSDLNIELRIIEDAIKAHLEVAAMSGRPPK